jgi:hypothetical protein
LDIKERGQHTEPTVRAHGLFLKCCPPYLTYNGGGQKLVGIGKKSTDLDLESHQAAKMSQAVKPPPIRRESADNGYETGTKN